MSILKIIDIPIILDLICDSLSPSDVFSCCKVNKPWNDLFTRYQWRTVKIVTPTSRCIWPSSTLLKLIIKNAHMIRSLNVDDIRLIDNLFEPIYSLPGLSDMDLSTSFPCHCSNLRSITCGMMSLAESDVDDRDRKNYPESFVTLINRNRRLLDLHVKQIDFRDLQYNAKFFSALASHPSLSSLNISSIGFINNSTYISIIQSIPSTLRSLSMLCQPTGEEEEEEEEEFTAKNTLSLSLSMSQPILGLRELHLRCRMFRKEDFVLFPLLRKCPQIESFTAPEIERSQIETMADILRESCPLITHLAVYWEHLAPSSLSTLITRAFPARVLSNSTSLDIPSPFSISSKLRSLTIGGWIGRIENPNPFDNTDSFNVLPEILKHCGSTLECLRIQEGLDIPWVDYSLILKSCPKLNELSYIDTTLYKPLRPIHGYSSTSPEELVSDEWVCKDIEILQMIIVDTSRKALQKDNKVSGILKHIYQRLGSLQKLKKLTLGWESLELDYAESNFSMKLEAGLGHLSGLKDLEVLHVWFDPPTDIDEAEAIVGMTEEESIFLGQKERDWMTFHWPKLREYKEMARPVPSDNEEY
ncbi:hypothetical protein BGZ46_001644 [Entomortierella lignicola]|nr:hypothetical protein BGZ46_001644 [Entomortierella lignicola]